MQIQKVASQPWRDYALQAANNERWGEALIALRRLELTEVIDGEMLLLLGKCHFKLSHFIEAVRAFEQAMMGTEYRGAALVELGNIAMARQDYATALAHYETALVYVPSSNARQLAATIAELQSLNRQKLAPGLAEVQTNLVFSGPAIEFHGGRAISCEQLGAANYSYAFAARGFLEALASFEADPEYVANPELIADAASRFNARKCIHLRFSPPTNPKMIRGAYNILVFAWEFDELPLTSNWPHPFADPRAMLERFDEVWLPSRHGAETIARLTDASVKFVPSPVLPHQRGRRWRNGQFQRGEINRNALTGVGFVPLSIFPALQPLLADHAKQETRPLLDIVNRLRAKSKIYLTIANPHDQRKNLRPLIEAFCEFARQREHAILLIKTSAADRTKETINDLIFSHQLARAEESLEAFISKSIWICNDSLNEDDLDELYALADFYICTPIAEGQNLPLLEAMLRGCVPIAPRHTAMTDYITTDNAIIIRSHRINPSEHLRNIYRLRSSEVDCIQATDVLTALLQADGLDQIQITQLASAAKATVRAGYGTDVLAIQWKRLEALSLTEPLIDSI